MYGYKNRSAAILAEAYEQINTTEFFKLLFSRPVDKEGQLPFEEEGIYETGRYNSIFACLRRGKNRAYVFHKGLPVSEIIKGERLAIVSPITYAGQNRTSSNARFLYAIAIDLDDVGRPQTRDFFHQIKTQIIPLPNIIVNSGGGLHPYYLLEHPIPLFEAQKKVLRTVKEGLTSRIWNAYTSGNENRQIQGIFQGFRIPGSLTKAGDVVEAFYNPSAPLWTPEKLCEYISDTRNITAKSLRTLDPASNFGIDPSKRTEAKPKGARSVRKTWVCYEGLYEWWLRQLRMTDTVKEGHRYFCIMVLAAYAIKSGVGYERLEADAFSLIDHFDELTTEETNHFTRKDVLAALHAYDPAYATLPIASIEKMSGIRVERNARNFRPQALHLKIARSTKQILKEQDLMHPEGPPTKARTVRRWQEQNPGRSKAECRRDTGLSRPTIDKWWSGSIDKAETIKEWKKSNPQGRKIDCYRETGISRPTIDKYWQT